MTVRVEKPAFNLREKLSQLDYGRVPYEKMPAGSIIQAHHFQSTSDFTFSNTSFTSGFKMKFTPKFASSKLFHQLWAVTYMHTGSGSAGQDGQIVRTYGGSKKTGTGSGNETIVHRNSWLNYLNRSGTNYAADYYPDMTWNFYDYPRTTDQICYDFQGRKYGGTSSNWSWRIGYQTLSNNSADTYIKGPNIVWTIMEVKG